MRSSVAITLVVCGTIFALMPSASDLLQGYQVSQFLTDRTIQSGITRIHTPFGETFRASAWLLGAAMIGVAVVGGGWPVRRNADCPEFVQPRRDMLAENDWRQYERAQIINS